MARNPSERQRVGIMETPIVPEGDDLVDELRAELRSARELIALREAREGPRETMMVPAHAVATPRLRGLSTADLRDHVERLERDVRDAEAGQATLEALAEDAAREDD